MSGFVHLHVHSEYSLLDGACRIPALVARAAELGQRALAITDHGVMYGVIDFYKEAKEHGIKPIIGCEVYAAPRTRFDKQHKIDSSPYHLVLLCKNETGYKNLIKLVSAGFIEGFYSKPRIDREILKQRSEGLIALSACLAGEVPRALEAGEYEKAKEAALWFLDVFGEGNYYIELQDHGIEEQTRILPDLVRLSRETGIPMAATNDVHYVQKEDAKMQNVLVCIQTNRTVQEGSDMEFATEEFYLKSEDEMRLLFGQYGGAIENTAKIADMCGLEFEFGQTKLPYFKAPGEMDNIEYIRKMSYEGLYRLYGENPAPSTVERLEYELGIITGMGYTDYFLIVHDFIAYAKSRGIPVGPGRGSGAGSLVAYCIGITGVDPMKYNLLFERFLNPERISMPDFDIDFCYERRQEVIDYVVQKYGADHVAQIVTFGTMAARGSLRDVGRALGMSYGAVDVIAKSVPFELGMTLDKALEVSPDFKRIYMSDAQARELIDMAGKVEGMVRHASTHAAGVVITREPADTYVPLMRSDTSTVTQFTMTTLEELGLLKMDFLGLRTLTVISDAVKMINEGRRESEKLDIEKIPLDDKAVFDMLSKAHTNGVFQFESGGVKNVLTQIKPVRMEDLMAVTSLYRPGPMDSIPRAIQGRQNPETVSYKHPMLKNALEDTYGCMVYQEQVMQICREMAGYSYGRADIVRRAMSKKKHEVMLKERQSFIYGAKRDDGTVECAGAVANGVDERTANEIFDEMVSFASYAFPKPHAAAYSLIAYQTAYLKFHHPKEFLAALLTSVLESSSKVADYIAEAKKLGINVLPPDINESVASFTVVGDRIRFGLLAIKNLGRGFINEIVAERRVKKFTGLLDFLKRMYGKELNRRAVESLIKCGAFDCFGHNRRQMETGLPALLDDIERDHRNNVSGQLNLFGDMEETGEGDYALPDVEEYGPMEKLGLEKEITGLYLSGHPLEEYSDVISAVGATDISRILHAGNMDGKPVTVAGIIMGRKTKTTKNGGMMAFAEIEDKTEAIEMIVFPKVYEQYSSILSTGSIVVARGRVQGDGDEEIRIICEHAMTTKQAMEAVERGGFSAADYHPNRREPPANYMPSERDIPPSPEAEKSASKRQGLYLKFPGEGSPLVKKASNVLFVFDGGFPVYFYYMDKRKYVQCPSSWWISPNDVMIGELKRILGDENVAYIV